MQDEVNRVANRIEGNLVEYLCPGCGAALTGEGIFHAFLPFVDHLIAHLCFKEMRELSQPFISNTLTEEFWFRDPDTYDVIPGLPEYDPNSRAWKRFLKRKEKLLSQAKFFLPDVADWLEKALATLERIPALGTSSLFVADELMRLVGTLSSEFDEQKQYVLEFKERLKETGMDPKWQGPSLGRSGFVASSMAGARWNLTPSSSREMVRQERLKLRGERLSKVWIASPHRWWDPDI